MARFETPDGWVVQAYRFALDPAPAQERSLWSHAGAARFARNHMLALVKAVLDQRAAERTYGISDAGLTPAMGWSLPALRRAWNARKATAAPWWAENSKEAYNTGLDFLARALDAWSKSRNGQRAGAPVGFPRFHTRHDRASVRFTTGTIRVEADRHHVTLPRLGTIRTHEPTRKLARRIEAGTGRILSATVTRDSSGRWHVAFQVLVRRSMGRPAHVGAPKHPVVGLDVGVKAGSLLVAATSDGVEAGRVPAPKSLTAAQARLRALQRRAARQRGPFDTAAKRKQQPSNRWRRTQVKIGKAHARATSLRRDALHKATTRLAQRHQVIAVETLSVAGMRRAGGTRKRGLNLALADAALAQVRRMLAYKSTWYGSTLVEADRWYPSSKTCSGCGSRKPRLLLSERTYMCEHCGQVLDRDLNAAINLARLGDTSHTDGTRTGTGSSPAAHQRVGKGRGATQKTRPAPAGKAGGREASTRHDTSSTGQTGTASPEGEAA
jgi:putative transposase